MPACRLYHAMPLGSTRWSILGARACKPTLDRYIDIDRWPARHHWRERPFQFQESPGHARHLVLAESSYCHFRGCGSDRWGPKALLFGAGSWRVLLLVKRGCVLSRMIFFWPLRYCTWLIITIRPLARKAKWNVDPPALRASACLSIFWWTATGTGSACSPFFESENDRQRLSDTVCDVIARVDTRHYGLVWWFPLLFLTIACTAWRRHASKPASS